MDLEAHSCIELSLHNVWYDTLDQPTIPIAIANRCNLDVVVKIVIKDVKGVELYSVETRLKRNEKKKIEVQVSYYGKVVVGGEWRIESTENRFPLKEFEVKL